MRTATTDLHELQKTIDTDVLVVGGGTAGSLAALAAAEEGARVLLIEQDSALGGTGTRGSMQQYWYGATGGLQDVIDAQVFQLAETFGGSTPSTIHPEAPPLAFHPEAKRSVLGKMMLERGVQVVFDGLVFQVLKDGNVVQGVRAATKTGIVEAHAKVTIDATGDGDVAAAAGAESVAGRGIDGTTTVYSLVPRRVAESDKLLHVNFNANWIDPLDPWDLSRGYVEGRKQLWEVHSHDHPLLSISTLLGVRDSRHIVGEYVLTFQDFLEGRHFDDVVVRCYAHYDNHAHDFGNESDLGQIWTVVLGLFFQGVWCDIPYRALLPRGLDGLLVACRALSVDRDASMGVRLMRTIQMVGEAAGVAAALSVRGGVSCKRLDVAALQRRLVERKVLQPADLQGASARNLSLQAGPLAGQLLDPGMNHENLARLVAYLSGKERGKALWWLWKVGERSVPLLVQALSNQDPRIRREAAFGLGLLGRREAVPQLMRTLATRDDDSDRARRGYPRWLAALVLLRLLAVKEAYRETLKVLDENYPPETYTFALSYLYDLVLHLDSVERTMVADALFRWANKPGMGENYRISPYSPQSLTWNLQLRAAQILGRCGDRRALALCQPYVDDERIFLRKAAALTLDIIQRELEATSGMAGGIVS
jgi:hypothetical protein